MVSLAENNTHTSRLDEKSKKSKNPKILFILKTQQIHHGCGYTSSGRGIHV
jgi:hypothetical protein